MDRANRHLALAWATLAIIFMVVTWTLLVQRETPQCTTLELVRTEMLRTQPDAYWGGSIRTMYEVDCHPSLPRKLLA